MLLKTVFNVQFYKNIKCSYQCPFEMPSFSIPGFAVPIVTNTYMIHKAIGVYKTLS